MGVQGGGAAGARPRMAVPKSVRPLWVKETEPAATAWRAPGRTAGAATPLAERGVRGRVEVPTRVADEPPRRATGDKEELVGRAARIRTALAPPPAPAEAASGRRGVEASFPTRPALARVRGETIAGTMVRTGRLGQRVPLPAPSLAAAALATRAGQVVDSAATRRVGAASERPNLPFVVPRPLER